MLAAIEDMVGFDGFGRALDEVDGSFGAEMKTWVWGKVESVGDHGEHGFEASHIRAI